jgi:hypothetical protein
MVADPNHLYEDPDPASHFNAYPDPAVHSNADPNPAPHQSNGILRPLVSGLYLVQVQRPNFGQFCQKERKRGRTSET